MNETSPTLPTDDGHIIVYPRPVRRPTTSADFPIEALPNTLRTVAADLAMVYQVPICLPAMAGVAIISGAVGKSVAVRGGYKDKLTRLNTYVLAIAERGSGKGVVAEAMFEPLQHRSQDLMIANRKTVGAKRGELGVLRKEIQRLESEAARADCAERQALLVTLASRYELLTLLETEATSETTLVVGDTTSEALGRALADNGETLFSFSAEAGAAVKVALGKYSDSGDFDLLLSGYSGDAVSVHRIGRNTVHLERPCLALLWFVQGCVLRQLVGDQEAFSRGLTARPLIFDSGARREHDDRKTLEYREARRWEGLINGILDTRLSKSPVREIACTAEAREVFAKFHDESVDLERGQFADLAGELSRWRENAIKVAGLFALADGLESISAGLAGHAVAVVRWCGYSYLGLLRTGRCEDLRPQLDRVLKVLNGNGGAMNLGPLNRNHGITREDIESLIAAFPTHLVIERLLPAGAGRPAEVLRAVA